MRSQVSAECRAASSRMQVMGRASADVDLCYQGLATVPSLLGSELALNPFLRPGDPGIRQALGALSASKCPDGAAGAQLLVMPSLLLCRDPQHSLRHRGLHSDPQGQRQLLSVGQSACTPRLVALKVSRQTLACHCVVTMEGVAVLLSWAALAVAQLWA